MSYRSRLLLTLLFVSVCGNVMQFALALLGPGSAPRINIDADYARREDRSDVWMPQTLPLDGTGLTANAGPWVYPDRPKFYSIDIEQLYPGGQRVLFERQFRVEELPAGFADRPVREVAAYDPATRTVTFAVGDQRLEYRLPESCAAPNTTSPGSRPQRP